MTTPEEKDTAWLHNLGRATREPWSAGLGLCFGCLPDGLCRLGITGERQEGDAFIADVLLGAEHEGGPGVAHGGSVASVLDEVLGHAVTSRGVMVVTKTLTVEFQRPTPVGVLLVARARAQAPSEGRSWRVTGVVPRTDRGAGRRRSRRLGRRARLSLLPLPRVARRGSARVEPARGAAAD